MRGSVYLQVPVCDGLRTVVESGNCLADVSEDLQNFGF